MSLTTKQAIIIGGAVLVPVIVGGTLYYIYGSQSETAEANPGQPSIADQGTDASVATPDPAAPVPTEVAAPPPPPDAGTFRDDVDTFAYGGDRDTMRKWTLLLEEDAIAVDPELVANVREGVWKRYQEDVKAGLLPNFKWKAEDSGGSLCTADGTEMQFTIDVVGEAPPGGYPLFICLHGGGGCPKEVNDGQWRQMQTYYKTSIPVGVYIAPRGITNEWNLHFSQQSYGLYDRVVASAIATSDVDPNRVYLLGFSAGGDGVYQIASRMPDRFASANMSSGHPNGVPLTNLYQLPFLIQAGENDTSYNRHKVNAEYGGKLKALQKEYPGGYVSECYIHKDAGHNFPDNDPARAKCEVYNDCAAWASNGSGETSARDTNAPTWVARFTREAVPRHVIWDTAHRAARPKLFDLARLAHPCDLFYWLDLSGLPSKEACPRVEVRAHNNRIHVASCGSWLRVLVDDRVVEDQREPVLLSIADGEQAFEVALTSSRPTMARTMLERGDPRLIFSSEITMSRNAAGVWEISGTFDTITAAPYPGGIDSPPPPPSPPADPPQAAANSAEEVVMIIMGMAEKLCKLVNQPGFTPEMMLTQAGGDPGVLLQQIIQIVQQANIVHLFIEDFERLPKAPPGAGGPAAPPGGAGGASRPEAPDVLEHAHALTIPATGPQEWTCDACGARSPAGRRRCSEGCDFDLCIGCYGVRCSGQHVMEPLKSGTCTKCSKDSFEHGWTCEQCSETLCQACGEGTAPPEAAFPPPVLELLEGAGEEHRAGIRQTLLNAGENVRELLTVLAGTQEEDEKAAVTFLLANMPPSDARTLPAAYIGIHAKLAVQARKNATWELPDDIFLNYVVSYACFDENRLNDNSRTVFQSTCPALIEQCITPGEAAIVLNQNIFKTFGVKYSKERQKANLNPTEAMQSGLASCTGLTIMFVAACRACGIPARAVGVPQWSTQPGNHTWAEVWSEGEWHVVGASESTALGQVWFDEQAAAADHSDPLKRIYAESFARAGTTMFPLAWRPGCAWVRGVDVTKRYKK